MHITISICTLSCSGQYEYVRCTIILQCDHSHSVSVIIPFSDFIFTHVSSVERSLSVRPIARDHCQTFVRMVYATYKNSASYISIWKATRHQLFRTFLLLKILCAVAMAPQNISRCSSVCGLLADGLVLVDHQRLLVRWKISLSRKWSGGLKFEIIHLHNNFVQKCNGRLIFERGIISSEYGISKLYTHLPGVGPGFLSMSPACRSSKERYTSR